MILPTRLAALALATFLWAPASHGQKPVIQTELLTLAFNGAFPGYYYRDGKNVRRLEASRQGISRPILYKGPAKLLLYENEADLAPPGEDEAAPTPALRVTLPTGTDRILILFAYSADKERLPGVKAYPISTKSMREGDYRLFNFSQQAVYAVLNEKKAATPPGKQSNISAASWKREIQDLEVQFGIRKPGEEIQPVYSSVWGHRPLRRNFIFVFDRPDKFRPLDVRMFYDVPSVRAARADAPAIEDHPPLDEE